MNRSQEGPSSWRQALLPVLTIIVLVAVKGFATPMYATTIGRFPAMMIEVMGSRTLLFGWAPAGYYEKLVRPGRFHWQKEGLTKWEDDPFRIRRLKPNLTSVTYWPVTNSPTNRFGHVGPQWAIIKRLGTRRVAILGDSITQGLGLDLDREFRLLTRQSAQRGSLTGSAAIRISKFCGPGISAYTSDGRCAPGCSAISTRRLHGDADGTIRSSGVGCQHDLSRAIRGEF